MTDVAAPELVAPAFSWYPRRADSLGGDVADLMGLFGVELDAEQRLALDVMAGVDAADRWTHREALVVEPRQCGKTDGILLPLALYVALSRPDQLVVWSAHRYKTAREAFLSIVRLQRRSPLLARRIAKLAYSNGEEAVEFTNGSRIVFVARSQSSGRGLSGDLVILDEALFVNAEMIAALMPIMSARPNGLVVYASSACLADSRVLRGVVDRLRAGGSASLAGVEWCSPPGRCQPECRHEIGTPGCQLDDRDAWLAANPAMRTGRITEEAIAAEREAMATDPLGFARERLGWHEEPVVVDNGISVADWNGLADSTAAPTGRLRLAVDAAPDHRWASAVVIGDGVLEVVEHRRGAAWLPARCAELLEAHDIDGGVLLDPDGPAGALLPEFAALGVKVVEVSGKDAVRATAGFVAAVREATIRHRGQADLTDAVMAARRRKVGDGSRWTRVDSSVDISPLVAATIAVWAASAKPRIPLTDEELLETFG